MYTERRHKCPYCFTEFKTGEDHGNVEFECRSCGNDFTLGEAWRGRPDTAKPGDVAALAERVATLEKQLAEVKATADMLNAVVGRMLPA